MIEDRPWGSYIILEEAKTFKEDDIVRFEDDYGRETVCGKAEGL
jgi:hypothetical protein